MKVKSIRTFLFVFVAVLFAASLAGSRPAAAAVAGDADQGGRPLTAILTGEQETPPADLGGHGTALITLNQGQGQVCWEITVSNLSAPVIAAHIHVAPFGVPGPIVVPLSAPVNGFSSGCASADPALIKAIRQHPENYYVNVHTTAFPGGAVRGQLGK
jgi:hypothetical protein